MLLLQPSKVHLDPEIINEYDKVLQVAAQMLFQLCGDKDS